MRRTRALSESEKPLYENRLRALEGNKLEKEAQLARYKARIETLTSRLTEIELELSTPTSPGGRKKKMQAETKALNEEAAGINQQLETLQTELITIESQLAQTNTEITATLSLLNQDAHVTADPAEQGVATEATATGYDTEASSSAAAAGNNTTDTETGTTTLTLDSSGMDLVGLGAQDQAS